MTATSAPLDTTARTAVLFDGYQRRNWRQTSRVFAVLMVAQWVFAILIAWLWSPYGWEGKIQSFHAHLFAAVFLGGIVSSLPLYLTVKHPEAELTRFVVAVAQMLWSALLIHLSGGRIETHFHVFVSIAFVAFYRDWRIIIVATLIVVIDHLLRGIFWPESIYGIANPEWWRFIEHAFWVVVEDVVMVLACLRGVEELRLISVQQAEAEALAQSEKQKTLELSQAMKEVKQSHEALSRAEKLAAVGQLAASVGHELRNPLAAVRNAVTYISKRVLEPKADAPRAGDDPRVKQFLELIDTELTSCNRIIAELLDFARERPPDRQPCPLRPLVDDAIKLVPPRGKVSLVNDVREDMPVPSIDKEQFRQVLINLVQNASESIPTGRDGTVVVRAEGGGDAPWRILVTDNGAGIPEDIRAKIFQPLFTTKTKGTGLGLAIVSGMVERHQGNITVESELGRGTTFAIQLPAQAIERAA